MIIFGIDPGLNGAIAVFNNNKIKVVFEIPVMTEGKKNKKQLNSAHLVKLLRDNLIDNEETSVVVEQVNAMPGQGVTSMFNFGQSFGVLKGIFSAMQIPMDFVSPVKWKKFFNLINTNKDASRTKAIEIYPYFSSKLSKKKDANKADAILISSFYYQNAKY